MSLILHAGDVGGSRILRELRDIAPVQAVYGNVDDRHDPALASRIELTVHGVSIHVSHGHELGSPTPEGMLQAYPADVVVFGHTHRAVIERVNGRLAVNPGAAGPRRFNLKPSVARLTIGENGPRPKSSGCETRLRRKRSRRAIVAIARRGRPLEALVVGGGP